MGNYVFLNKSNFSIVTDLSVWHVEATPLPDNTSMLRSFCTVRKNPRAHLQNWSSLSKPL